MEIFGDFPAWMVVVLFVGAFMVFASEARSRREDTDIPLAKLLEDERL